MTNCFDVAGYILKTKGPMSAWKLQKLTYYSQAWSVTWRDAPLFNEKIEAWANGPVCRSLYDFHKGQFIVESIATGEDCNLTNLQKTDIGTVLDFYTKYSGQQLSDITHSEPPWQKARENMSPTERGTTEITLSDMSEYYGSL